MQRGADRFAGWSAGVLLLLAGAAPLAAQAQIVVDGWLDEPQWSSAVRCRDWRRTEPFALDTPRYATETRIASLPEGLAVAFVVDQPPAERRIKTRTPRDTDRLSNDYVQVLIDFDATGQVGYEFTVGLGGGVRDGLITNQVEFDRDWDGVWQSAVRETDDRWFVELLIPWSTVNMRSTTTAKRTVGVYASRFLFDRNERYACPGISDDKGVFLSDFKRVEIEQYNSAMVLDVVPYATVLSDLIDPSQDLKVGADIIWKPNNDVRLAAALNPDFGQIESDELVVNFSAIETTFTDKRPFFTESQGIFDLRTPRNGQLIYTRRVGAAPDDFSAGSSDIDAAVKLTGSAGKIAYGVLAAQEERYQEDIGRLFTAARVAANLSGVRLGYLGTWTDRPLLTRSAAVNALDYEIARSRDWRLSGQALRSDITTDAGSEIGYSAWMQADLNRSDPLSHTVKLLYIDERFEMNDLGYMERSSLRRGEWATNRQVAATGDSGRIAGELQTLRLTYQENLDGDRLTSAIEGSRDVQYRSSWRSYQQLRYLPSSVDDLISRGNGPVRLQERVDVYGDVTSPRFGRWRYIVGGNLFQQGVEGYSGSIEFNTTWYATDALTLRLIALPELSEDWLLWRGNTLFGSYRSKLLQLDFRADWIPRPRHELRLRWQWLGIDAEPRAAYRNAADGELMRTAEELEPFTVSSLAVQFRYRYEIGPQSDFYIVYSRGGFQRFEEQRSLGGLFGDMLDVRDSDQLLLKVRYRL
ncbi:MAG TPA: DUF5916 domain-containing protein [Steroidobacteraceae bacterium]|jgi:hypothetical protein|nr:DUF5916 domain-containing protein [Steroidobacteraceae bacterium]